MEGARGIEPPPGFADRANGFEDRGAPSTIAPATRSKEGIYDGLKTVLKMLTIK